MGREEEEEDGDDDDDDHYHDDDDDDDEEEGKARTRRTGLRRTGTTTERPKRRKNQKSFQAMRSMLWSPSQGFASLGLDIDPEPDLDPNSDLVLYRGVKVIDVSGS